MVKCFLILFYLASLLSCSSHFLTSRDKDSLPAELQNDPQYSLASAFDSLLRLNSDDASIQESVSQKCTSPTFSPLCSSLKKIKILKSLLNQKGTVYQPPVIKPLAPLSPTWANNKITNWKSLRNAPIPNLLKGFLALSQKQLIMIADQAIREKKCPNNVAVATAATLEDYLPGEIPVSKLASLYERGGICTKSAPIDKEHFLTRSGILFFLAKDFSKAASVLSKVNPTDAYSGRAAYWLYRAKKELGDTSGVSQSLRRLSNQHRFSFHNLVASYQEKREPVPEFSRSLSFPNRSSKFKKLNEDIQSVELLIKFGFEESAQLLVDWLLTQPKVLEPGLRIYLAHLGDSHAKVVQMPGILMFHPELISRESISINYPQAYLSFFEKYRRGLSPYLLLAIARRESSFNPKAVSPANAQGLLQMNPETVKELYPGETFDLLNAETNISIASKYLAKVIDEMNGDLPLTLAAYNAGDAQARTWERRYPREDKILWIDLIPYRETRDYVANVLSTYHWYRKIYENNSDFSDLLPR